MPFYINDQRMREMEKRLGCTFSDEGEFAEMALSLADYREKTHPIEGVMFGVYEGDATALRELVATIDDKWCRYFTETTRVFCAFSEGEVVSFCIVDTNADCMLSHDALRVGSIGCVGTIEGYRHRGIGLRMVDLASVYLKREGCALSYVSYTHIDFWYQKLGYQTFARFSFT